MQIYSPMPCTTLSSSSLPAVCTGRVIVFEHAQYASQYLVGEVTHTSLPSTTTTSEASLLTVHACLTCSPVTSTAGTTTDMHSDTIMKAAQSIQQDTISEGRANEERHNTHDADAEDTSNIDRQHNNNNKADVPRIVLRCRPLRGSQASTSSAVQPAQDDLHELHSRRTSLLHDMATSQARMTQIHATLTKLRAIPSSSQQPSQQPLHSETDIHTGAEGVAQGSDAHIAHETRHHHATSSSSTLNSHAMEEPGQLDSAVMMMYAAAVNEPVRPASVSCETLSSMTAASPVTTTTTTARRMTMMSTLAEADTSVLTMMPTAAAVNTAKAQLRQARAALHSVPACDWADLRRQFHPSPALQSLIETVLLVLSLSRGESGTQVQYGRIWQLKDLPQRLQHVSAKTLRHRTPHPNTHTTTTTTTSNSTSRTSGCAGKHILRIADIVRDCVQAERTRRALHDHVTARPLYQWLCALLAVYMADEEQGEEREEIEGRRVGEYSMRAESVASQSGMSDLCASSLRSAIYRSSLRRSTKDDKKNEGGVCHDHNNNNTSDIGLTHVVEAAPRVASRSPSAVAPEAQPIATHNNITESSDHALVGEGVEVQQQEEERQDMMSCARLEKELREHSDYVALAEEELHELDELIAQLTQALTDTPLPLSQDTTTTTARSSAEDATHAACPSSSSSGDMPCATGVTTKDAASSTDIVVGVVLQIGPGQVCGVLSDAAGRALMRYVTTTTTTSLVQQQQSTKDSEFIVPQHTHESSNDRCDNDVAAAFDELTAIVARHIMNAAASDNSVQPDSHHGKYADKADTKHNNTTTTITTTTGKAATVRDAMAGETHTMFASTTQADSTATTTEEKVEEEVQRTTTTATALSLPSAPPVRLSTSATITNNGTTTTTSPLPSVLRGATTHTEGHTTGHHYLHIRRSKSNSQGAVPAYYSSCSRPASRPGSRASSQHSHKQRSSEKIKTKADTLSHSHVSSSHDKSHSLAKASEERTMRLLLQEELHASHAEVRRLRAERDRLRAELHRRRHCYNNTTTSTSPTANGNEEDIVSDSVVTRDKGTRQKRQQYKGEAVRVISATLDTDNNAQKEEKETAGAAVSSVTGQRAAKDNAEYNKTYSSASSSSSSSSNSDDDDSAWERLQAELKAAHARIAQLEQQQQMKEAAAKDKANGTVTSAAASADATTTTVTGKGSTEAANNTTPSSAAAVGQMLLYSPAEALAAQQRLTEQVSALQAVVQQHERRAHSLEVDLNAALHRCTAAEQTIQRQRRELAAVWAQLGSTNSSNNHATSQSGQPPTTTTTDTQLLTTSLVGDADAAQASSSPTSLLLPQHTTSSSATDAMAEPPCAPQPLTTTPAPHEAHEDHTALSTHTNTVPPPPSRLDTSSLSSITQSEDMSTMTGATLMTLGTTTTTANVAMNTRHRPAMLHSTRTVTTSTSKNNNKDNTVTSAAMASSLVSSFATITTTHNNNNNNSNGVSYRHDCFALPPTGPAVEPMTPLELRHEVYRLRQELERYYVEGLRYKTALQTLRERQHEERRRRSEMRVVRYSVLQNLQESINNIVQKQDQDMRQVAQLLEHSREELSMSTPSRMGST